MKLTGILLVSLLPQLVAAQPAADGNIYHEGWIDFNKNGVKDVYEDPAADVDKRVADLLGQMTVEEKTCQMVTLYGYGRVLKDPLPTEGWKDEVWKDGIANIDEHLNGIGKVAKNHPELVYPFSNHIEAKNTVQRWFVEQTRLGIPVDFTNEGIHGLNHFGTTSLPAPIGIGSTWNRELVREAGEIVGKEAKALGYTNVYAPILDVARDPRWGRVLECYGEEPYHISELGIQMVEGIQEQGVGATLKHYAVYSIPKGGRDAKARTDAHVAPRELHSMYMYPFKKVIQKSQPMGVMSSYNDWDGVPVSASHYFLTELLRKEYGFKGYVVSDSEAVEYVYTKHRVAPDYQDAVRQVVEAGLNVRTNFSQPKKYIDPLRRAIAEGQLSMEAVDRAVADVLRFKFEIGLFDDPYTKNDGTAEQVAGADRHQDFMLEMQKQSLVLLKNDGLLPLDAGKIRKVLVTGPLAKEENYMVSRYGPQGLDNINIYEGIAEYLKGKAEVVYAKGCEVVDEEWPDSEIVPTPMTPGEKKDIKAAVKAASRCDVIIAVLGEDELRTGESRSRTSLELPGRQQALLEALHATGKPVVLVLVNGQPLTINWADRNIPSILEAWFPGCMGGKAVAQTLFGEYNPGGKLTMTFPKTTGQLQYNFPFKPGSHGAQNRKGPNGAGNTRVVGALYPFGHGLSYTAFEYSDLNVKQKKVGAGSPVTVTVDVRNTGSVAGDEVVQLYVRDVASSVITYDSQLRGFERISLEPGEKKTVTFVLQPEDLQILDADYKWTVEPGDFEVLVGASSEDIRLKDGFTIVEKETRWSTNPDRQLWLSTLDRFARPVLQHLSQGTLKANMPVKPSCMDRSHLEALGRLLDGMAPWLELGPDDTPEGRLRAEYIDLACRSIANAVDPSSPDYLNFNQGRQPLVDAAFLCQALLRAPKQLWGRLDPVVQKRLVKELKSSLTIKPHDNNWLLFTSTVETALFEFTGEWDKENAMYGVRRFRDDWYVGDGWYADGPKFHMDYYNSYVIHPMLYQVLETLSGHGMQEAADFMKIERPRYARYAAILERLISPEGTFPCVGRSICYRVGAMHALSDVACRHLLPKGVKPAQVRCALTAVIERQMSMPDTYDDDGWLTLGFAGCQPELAEGYISTGSLYLCSFAYAALGLPETDPFWSDPAEDWTAKKAWNGVRMKADHAIRN